MRHRKRPSTYRMPDGQLGNDFYNDDLTPEQNAAHEASCVSWRLDPTPVPDVCILHETIAEAIAPLASTEIEASIHAPDLSSLWWPMDNSPHNSDDVVHNTAELLTPGHQNYFPANLEEEVLEQLDLLHYAPSRRAVSPEAVSPNIPEDQQPRNEHSASRLQQQMQHVQKLPVELQIGSQQQHTGIHYVLSPAEQQQSLHQMSSPVSPVANRTLPANQSVPHSEFLLPQNIAGTAYRVEPEDPQLTDQLVQHILTSLPYAFSGDNANDPEKYVRQAEEKAAHAKERHRMSLKKAQKEKEASAAARGEPLSAKDKERERSRRESEVTRKRRQIYTKELERTARRVPSLERAVACLQFNLARLREELSRSHMQSSAKLQSESVITGMPCSED